MYLSEYCDVKYEENYNVVFVKWKKFCCRGLQKTSGVCIGNNR